MVTLAQRIEELRTEVGLSRPGLSAAMGFPKGAIEKFETGRQTPTKEQQEKIAAYFGVSLFYLRGESRDRTRQDDWMSAGADTLPEREPAPVPAPRAQKRSETAKGGTVLDSLLVTKQMQDTLRSLVLDTLRSPEGQEILTKLIRKELGK